MTSPKLRVLSLFAGIGGFDLGLERTGGFETVAFCEIDPFAVRVLNKHWPKVPVYEDVRELTADRLRADGIAVDVICGGFPCQDISKLGTRCGIKGARSGLWDEYGRLIGELRPSAVIIENVANLIRGGLGAVLYDLSKIGYDADWHVFPASQVGAPHVRERVWIVAYPSGVGRLEIDWYVHKAACRPKTRQPTGNGPSHGWQWEPEPQLGRVVHGLPNRVDRLRCLGNAVVPQIPEMIGRAILAARASESLAA